MDKFWCFLFGISLGCWLGMFVLALISVGGDKQ